MGFVCQKRLTSDPRFIHFMPGVSLEAKGDSLGQSYSRPEDAVNRGADVVIVGRAIIESSDMSHEAERIRNICYSAYQLLVQDHNGHI